MRLVYLFTTLSMVALLYGSAPALAQTMSQKRACTPDVLRLCRRFIPWRGPITRCLIASEASLSPACHAVILGQ